MTDPIMDYIAIGFMISVLGVTWWQLGPLAVRAWRRRRPPCMHARRWEHSRRFDADSGKYIATYACRDCPHQWWAEATDPMYQERLDHE